MRTMVSFAQERHVALELFIREHVTGQRAAYDVSDAKRDGTVIVRFRSTSMVPAAYLVDRMARALAARDMAHERPSDCHVRMRLDLFEAPSAPPVVHAVHG